VFNENTKIVDMHVIQLSCVFIFRKLCIISGRLKQKVVSLYIDYDGF